MFHSYVSRTLQATKNVLWTKLVFACLELTIETLEHGVKYVKS